MLTSNCENKSINHISSKPVNDIIIEEDEDVVNEELEDILREELELNDNYKQIETELYNDTNLYNINNENRKNINSSLNLLLENDNDSAKVNGNNNLEHHTIERKEIKENGVKNKFIDNDKEKLGYVVIHNKNVDDKKKNSILSKRSSIVKCTKNNISDKLLSRVPSGPRKKKKKNNDKQVVFESNSKCLVKERRNSTELASMVYEKIHKRHIRREKGMSGIRNSLRTKPKAISAAKERRGVKVLGIILGCFTICWTPFFIMYVVIQFCKTCTINPHIEMFITWLGYSNSAMNPIIYTVFNRDYQIALKRLFTSPEKVSLLGSKR